IQHRCGGMNATNERALAAADEAHAQFAIEWCVGWHDVLPGSDVACYFFFLRLRVWRPDARFALHSRAANASLMRLHRAQTNSFSSSGSERRLGFVASHCATISRSTS